jgi:hypothetical protein
METKKEMEESFLLLARRFRAAADAYEVKLLGNEIGRFIFGESTPRRQHNANPK